MMTRRLSTIVLLCVAAAFSGCHKLKAADHTRRGNAYFEDKRFPEAIIEFRAALQSNPRLGDVRLKLGDAYMSGNDVRNALGEYVRASDLLPNSAEAQVKAARLLLLARQFEDAKARADRAIALDPKNVEAQIVRGNALAGLKDFDAAMAEYQDAIALDPEQHTAYSNLGILQLAQGKQAEAEQTFRKAVEAAPKSVPARLALANFFVATGNQTEGENTMKAALELDPRNLEANRGLGFYYLASGRGAEAEPYFVNIAKFAKTDAASLALADYYTVVQRPEDARRVLKEIAANESAYAQANVRLAALDAAEGHRAQAQQRIREVLEKRPRDTPALLLNARLFFLEGKRAEARRAAAAVIAVDARSTAAIQAYMLTGQIEAASDRTDEAIKAYEQVLKLQPSPLAANIALSRLYLTARNASKAKTYAQQALGIQRGNPEAQSLLIRSELLAGDLSAASTDLAALEKAFPNAIGVVKLNALVQLASRKPELARAAYERVLKASPRDLEALSGLMQVEVNAGHAKEAAARVDEYLKGATPTVDLLMLAARAHGTAGNGPRVEELLKQAIEADPERLQAYAMLGRYYAGQRRLDEAVARFRDVIARNPNSVPAGTMIGMLLEAQGQIADAEQQYGRVLAVDGRAAVAANNLAWIYVDSNRKLDEALQLAQVAQQQMPDEPNVNDTLGWIYYRKNLAAQAVPHLEMAAKGAPNEASHQFHLAMAYVQTGDWPKARDAFKRVLAMKPELAEAPEAKKARAMIGA